jgi:hypothetical protein
MAKKNLKEQIQNRITEQRQWIEEHGGNLPAYVKRYGSPSDENCYGNGGEAIYNADVGELRRLEAMLG